MGVLSSLTSALTAFNASSVNVDSEGGNVQCYRENNGKVSSSSSMGMMRKKQGLPLNYGSSKLGYVENVLQMMS